MFKLATQRFNSWLWYKDYQRKTALWVNLQEGWWLKLLPWFQRARTLRTITDKFAAESINSEQVIVSFSTGDI